MQTKEAQYVIQQAGLNIFLTKNKHDMKQDFLS